jgi:hypothetical protein
MTRHVRSPLAVVTTTTLTETASARVRTSRGILLAIERGELLSEAPLSRRGRQAHEAALSLLALLDEQLESLLAELEGANPQP